MFFIDTTKTKFNALSDLHYRTIRCLIQKRIGSKNKCAKNCTICNSKLAVTKGMTPEIRAVLENDKILRELILAIPEDLKKVSKKNLKQIIGISFSQVKAIKKKKTDYLKDQKIPVSERSNLPDLSKLESDRLNVFSILNKVIDYEGWFNKLDASAVYGPYKLAEELGMRSCTYCNRQFTLTVKSNSNKSGKLTRPQFDHWISKDEHPLLGLSFYNLIPSCPTCNSSVKGKIKFDIKTHLHPYIDDYVDHFNFGFEFWAAIGAYNIKVGSNHIDPSIRMRIDNTLKAFKLEEVYNGHHPELDDLVQLTKAYSYEYIKYLKTAFPDANLTTEQIYRFAFGTELNKANFHKRPMSKFKHDILKELGIIK